MARKIATAREMFLAGPRPKVERVDIEGYGPVYVRAMSAGELGRFEAERSQDKISLEDFLARFAISGVCDEAGSLLFTLEDLDELKSLEVKFLTRVMEAVVKVNGLTDDEVDSLGKP